MPALRTINTNMELNVMKKVPRARAARTDGALEQRARGRLEWAIGLKVAALHVWTLGLRV